ncbi:MAG: signal recognition particle-docking protein FtsY [Thaumarchaeota archaeon]|nr:signal recognition particle-docking protein FtsY [Nitrososphaerota archaeon]
MFEKLKTAFNTLVSAASEKTISEADADKILWDFELALLESDVAQEVVAGLVKRLKEELVGNRVKRSIGVKDILKTRLQELLIEVVKSPQTVDIFQKIEEKKQTGEPFIIVFLGINGTGKTTTIAKFAYVLKQHGFSVVMAAGDTHRAGAIEQLGEHATRLSIKHVAQKYGADPAAVARDAVLYAKAHHIDVVLVDTAGRMQTSRNLMDEMAKIVRVTKPDFTVFVGDALAGNDAVSQAKEFLAATNFDAAILTKADADVKGGAALAISYVTKKPILFLGVGQTYDSLTPFNPASFAESLIENNSQSTK